MSRETKARALHLHRVRAMHTVRGRPEKDDGRAERCASARPSGSYRTV